MNPRATATATAAATAAIALIAGNALLFPPEADQGRGAALRTGERWLTAGDFKTAADGSLVSGAIEAPVAFESLGLSWRAKPEAVVMRRVSPDGERWGAWARVVEDRHGPPGGGKRVGELQFLDRPARFLQLRVDGPDAVQLGGVHAVFTEPVEVAPPPAPGRPRYRAASEENPVPKPDVVSRTDWGCPDGQGSRWAPVATDVDFLIVHHSAGSNRSNNWAATVQGIWSFHALTRGWGDIGYNFLIDPDGVIYEGRAGDDSIGAHFSCTNGGTMGVCVIGNYTSVEPTRAALDSLAWLLAWKADQKGIDPRGRGFHPPSGLSLDRISGHRDGNPGSQGCASGTVCPGAMLYPLLPALRSAAAGIVESGSPSPPELELAGFVLDAEMRPGAAVGLGATLRHVSGGGAREIAATLSTSSPYVTVTDAQETYRDLADGDSGDGEGDFALVVAPDAPHGHAARLRLDVVADGGSWSFAIALPPVVTPPLVALFAATANPAEVAPGATATLSYLLEADRPLAAEFGLALVDSGGVEHPLAPFATGLAAGPQTKNRGSVIPGATPPGDYGLRVQISAGAGLLVDRVFPAVLTVLAPGFADWAAASISNPDDRAPGADPDGDGVENLLEFALLLDPLGFDTHPLEFLWVEAGDERYPAVRFIQRAGLASDVVVEVDAGDGRWSGGSAEVNAQVLPGSLRRLVRSELPVSAAPLQLIRARFVGGEP